MSAVHTPAASYTLVIKADSGYESTTEGRCTAAQYGSAIGALHGKPHAYAEMRQQNAELLEALHQARRELHACQAVIHLNGGFDPQYVSDAQAALKVIDAAIHAATGSAA